MSHIPSYHVYTHQSTDWTINRDVNPDEALQYVKGVGGCRLFHTELLLYPTPLSELCGIQTEEILASDWEVQAVLTSWVAKMRLTSDRTSFTKETGPLHFIAKLKDPPGVKTDTWLVYSTKGSTTDTELDGSPGDVIRLGDIRGNHMLDAMFTGYLPTDEAIVTSLTAGPMSRSVPVCSPTGMRALVPRRKNDIGLITWYQDKSSRQPDKETVSTLVTSVGKK